MASPPKRQPHLSPAKLSVEDKGAEIEIGVGESAAWVSDVAHGYAALGEEPVESVLVIRSPHRPSDA